MSLKSSLRFFWKGPGLVLVIIGAILLVGFVIKQGQDRKTADLAKRQTTRPLGAVNPRDAIDVSQASREAVISDRKLSPALNTVPETPAPIPNAPVSPQGRAQTLPTLVSFYSQVQATPSPTPTPEQRPRTQEIWLPRGTFIPCALVNTVESSHINTPVVGEVIRDVMQAGHMIIPAGSIVTCFAQAGAVRDRIEVSGKWSITYPDGKEFELNGIACNREADPSNQQFGIEDGSAGLQGDLEESDHWSNAKAFIALLLSSATEAGTAAVSGAISHGTGAGVGVGLPDTTPILSKYLDQLLNGETGDSRFVRVPASKEFYLFPVDIVEPSRRSPGAKRQEAEEAAKLDRDQSNQSSNVVDMERELLRNAQPDASPTPTPRIHYGQ